MKVANKSIIRNKLTTVAALLAGLVAISPNAGAKHRAATPAPEPASVVGHLPLPGITVSQLELQQHGSKQYLYVEGVTKDGFAIVDVTKPGQPDVIKSEAWPDGAFTEKLQLVSGRLALVEAPDATMETVSRTETLKVLDLSDPANPRPVLTFSGVTSTLADDAHNLVYITNGEGLWILRNNQALASAAKQDACTSDDAYNDVASCQ
ncbi:MAG: hypothetical protein WCD49_07690 [Candidatus Acidiferrales bacterium]